MRVERADAADEASLHAALRAHARRPFDLANDQLLRALVLRTGADEAVLQLVVHHVTSDGWSRNVTLRDLGALYAARRRGARATLEPLPIDYADYAVWQRAEGERAAAEDLAWWRAALEGAPAQLDLPSDRPRTGAPSFDGARLSATIPRETLDALARARAPRERVAVHGAARGVRRAAAPTHGTDGSRRRLAGRGTRAHRDARRRRAVREHARAARPLRWRPDVHRAARPRARRVPGRVRASGAAVRAAGERAAARARRRRRHARADVVLAPRRGAGSARARRRDDRGARDRAGLEQGGPDDRGRRTARWARRAGGIPHRPVRPQHDRAARAPLRRAARRDRDRCASRDLDASAARRGGACGDRGAPAQARAMRARRSACIAWSKRRSPRSPQATAVVDERRTLTYAELDAEANRLARHLIATGVRARRRRGDLPAASRRDGRRAAGDAEDGRALRAARSGVSRRPAGVHPGGLGREGRRRDVGDAGARAGERAHARRARRSARRAREPRRGAARCGRRARVARLRAAHVRAPRASRRA